MPKIRLLNNLTGQYIEYDEPEIAPLPPPTEAELEAQYKARVAALMLERYTLQQEAGYSKDAISALALGQPLPEPFLECLAYRETCKDKAHLEVYGYERG